MARATRAQWATRIARWERSGLTAARFAEREGINPGTLSFWKWKLRQRAQTSSAQRARADAVTFVEVLGTAPTTTAIEVVLPAGYRIAVPSGFDAATLRALLTVLEAAR